MSTRVKSQRKQLKQHVKEKGLIYKAGQAANALIDIAHKDVLGAISKALTPATPRPRTGMSRPRGRRQRPRRRRRNRRTPPSMRVTRIPIKRCVMYDSSVGTKHRWYYAVPLSLICASLDGAFDEFKVPSLSVRYVPNNATSETGLYTAVLLDREGFGGFGAATATSWFSYIASMPGSVIKPRHIPTTFRWKPTEPTARDWLRKEKLSGHTICTVYICNNGEETEELGGLLDIRATLLVRGRYYNAAVKSDGLLIPPPPLFSPSSPDHPPPGHLSPVQSASGSEMSIVANFQELEA